MGDFDDTSVNGWLETNGYQLGMRYPHTSCPVNPSVRAVENSPPVQPRQNGIRCYICQADGVTHGSSSPGWFPYSSLIGTIRENRIALAVRNFTHYGHAKFLLRCSTYNDEHSRYLYNALLKITHGEDDPRIGSVFVAGGKLGLVRHVGYWADNQGTILPLGGGSAILKSLPTCHYIDEETGKVKVNPATVESLSMPADLTAYGYPAVEVVRGIHLTQFIEQDPGTIYTVRQPQELIAASTDFDRTPKYTKRRLKNYKDVIEQVVPNVNWKLLNVLLAAMACTETRRGLPPMLILTGPTGVGKSSHTTLASAIVGDNCENVGYNRDRDRFLNSVRVAKQKSRIVLHDEYFKLATSQNVTHEDASSNMLAYSTNMSVYLIHVGGVPFGRLPAFVYTDTKIPEDVYRNEQIGRRLHHYKLNRTLNWSDTLANAGIEEPSHIRLRGNRELIDALNTYLSEFIDEYLTADKPNFAEICIANDIHLLSQSEQMDDKRETIRQLYKAVCEAPPLVGTHKTRWPKPGMVLVTGMIEELFSMLQTDSEQGGTDCRALDESDIMSVLGKKEHAIRVERTSKHGRQFCIRFVSENGKVYNAKLQ